jgi:hypothetical protein
MQTPASNPGSVPAAGELAALLRRLNSLSLGIVLSPEEMAGRKAPVMTRERWAKVFALSRCQRN